MQFLREDTASQTVLFGPMIDDTDFKTPKTGLTITAAEIKFMRHNGTSLIAKNSGNAAELSDGYYYATLDATDTQTAGRLDMRVIHAACLPVWKELHVLTANVYDSLIVGTANLLTASTSNIKRAQALAGFTFAMTDSTNHALATGKTVTGTRSLDGAAFAAGTLGSPAEIGSTGIYKCDLGTGDTTASVVTLKFTASGCDDAVITIITVP